MAHNVIRTLNWVEQGNVLHTLLCPRRFTTRAAFFRDETGMAKDMKKMTEAECAATSIPDDVRLPGDPSFLEPDGADPPPAVRLKVNVAWIMNHVHSTHQRIQILWGLKNSYPSDVFKDILGWLAKVMDPEEYSKINQEQPYLGLQSTWGRPPPVLNENWVNVA